MNNGSPHKAASPSCPTASGPLRDIINSQCLANCVANGNYFAESISGDPESIMKIVLATVGTQIQNATSWLTGMKKLAYVFWVMPQIYENFLSQLQPSVTQPLLAGTTTFDLNAAQDGPVLFWTKRETSGDNIPLNQYNMVGTYADKNQGNIFNYQYQTIPTGAPQYGCDTMEFPHNPIGDTCNINLDANWAGINRPQTGAAFVPGGEEDAQDQTYTGTTDAFITVGFGGASHPWVQEVTADHTRIIKDMVKGDIAQEIIDMVAALQDEFAEFKRQRDKGNVVHPQAPSQQAVMADRRYQEIDNRVQNSYGQTYFDQGAPSGRKNGNGNNQTANRGNGARRNGARRNGNGNGKRYPGMNGNRNGNGKSNSYMKIKNSNGEVKELYLVDEFGRTYQKNGHAA